MSKRQRVKERAASRRAITAACVALALAACSQGGRSAGTETDPVAAPAAPASALGSYLAARHAQQQRDYARAAEYMSRALADDPGNSDLVRRTFVLRVSEGRMAEAVPLAHRIGEADEAYKKLLAGQAQPTWRAVEVAGNFYERHQRSEEARRLYEGLAAGDQGAAVVAPALQRIARGEVPPRIIASPQDGMAEALFDLASILDQRETLDASLIYARLALDLRPNFPLAQMLVAEIDEDQKHTAEALALYRNIDAKSTLAWTARLRAALALDALDRTDEAAGELKRMATE